ncbi:MAG: HEAT repeat domain-containing protein, partial [Planctomycetota bacterium]|nr:HEAT repeat domain-containing protein [Planctomycetota bacterium]
GETLGKVLADLGALQPEQQVVLLGLAQDKAVLPAAVKALTSDSAEVRSAAIKAIGRVGGAAEIPALLTLATKGGPDAKEAQAALGALKDPKADDALLGLLSGPDASARASAVQMLKGRNATRALPEILKAAGDADESVRLAALEAVAALAGADRYPAVVQLMLDARSDSERAAAERTVVVVARKAENAAERLAPLAAGLKSAASAGKAAVLRVLGILGGPEAFQCVKERLQDADAAVADAASRALAEWPDVSAADDLLKLMQQAKDAAPRTLALRGYLRLARLPEVTPQARTKMLEQVKAVAQGDQEKKMLLSGLSGTPTAEALEAAASFLEEQPVRAEAELAVLAIAKAAGGKADRKRVDAVLKKLVETSQNKENVSQAKVLLGLSANIAPSGKAASLAGWAPDGAGGPASAAIDNSPDTYWDEEDGKNLYRIAVTFGQPRNVGSISILGFQQHSYAPKDFDIVADGKVIKEVRNAQYTDNLFRVSFPATQLKTIELKITGYYGGSPAIREWGIYEP